MEVNKESAPAANLRHGRLSVGPNRVNVTPPKFFETEVTTALKGVLIRNVGPNVLCVGGENVTTSDGFRVTATNALHIPLDDPSGIWLVSDDLTEVDYLFV